MVNIVTVEDPVEANVDGVNQVQVNPKANLTFGNALRSILRQDPDIIMIDDPQPGNGVHRGAGVHHGSPRGEYAAYQRRRQQRHAPVDMGVESYLIADALTGIIAQRLVRRLCPNCKRRHVFRA